MSWLFLFLLLSLLGLGLETAYRGWWFWIKWGDRSWRADTPALMGPIYGVGGSLLYWVHYESRHNQMALGSLQWWGFILSGLLFVYTWEFISHWLLEAWLGLRLWEYSHGVHIDGRVRLDYAPLWTCLILGFDALACLIDQNALAWRAQ